VEPLVVGDIYLLPAGCCCCYLCRIQMHWILRYTGADEIDLLNSVIDLIIDTVVLDPLLR
jgi:hypothetical protein